MFDISIGLIKEITEGGKYAKVEGMQGELYDEVLLINQEGSFTNPVVGDDSLVVLLRILGSNTNLVGIPYNIQNQPTLENGEKEFGIFPDLTIKFSTDKILLTSGTTTVTINKDGDVESNKSFDSSVSYKVSGTQVVTSRQPAITPPTGGSVIDAEARTAIATIITTLQTHGLTL